MLEAVSGDCDIIATATAKADPMVRLDVTVREDERRSGELSSREDRRSLGMGRGRSRSFPPARREWGGQGQELIECAENLRVF